LYDEGTRKRRGWKKENTYAQRHTKKIRYVLIKNNNTHVYKNNKNVLGFCYLNCLLVDMISTCFATN
jgi:hypothetical protein